MAEPTKDAVKYPHGHPLPSRGGSYTYDPKTDELTENKPEPTKAAPVAAPVAAPAVQVAPATTAQPTPAAPKA